MLNDVKRSPFDPNVCLQLLFCIFLRGRRSPRQITCHLTLTPGRLPQRGLTTLIKNRLGGVILFSNNINSSLLAIIKA